MKKGLLLGIVIALMSCSSNKRLAGTYNSVGTDYKYKLILYRDSTFLFTDEYFDGSSKCEGKWRIVSKKTLTLQCKEENILSMLQSGYMTDRVKKLMILNRFQVKLGSVILTKAEK